MTLREILQKLRLVRTPVFEESDFLVTVYVMSEGTAQGIPRPLQVFKLPLHYSIDTGERWVLAAEHRVAGEVGTIIRLGYTHTLSDGTNVTYAPHTIYKITSKEITND